MSDARETHKSDDVEAVAATAAGLVVERGADADAHERRGETSSDERGEGEKHDQVRLPRFADVLSQRSFPRAGPDLMIALDIDGTILHHDTTLSERVKKAIHAHIAAGTRILVATGRGVAGTQVALEQIDMTGGLAVCSNGAVILSIGDTLPAERTSVLPDFVQTGNSTVHLLRSHTFEPCEEIKILSEGIPGAIFALECLERRTRITEEFPENELSGETELVPIEDLCVPNATRLTLRANHMTPTELLDAVNKLCLKGVEYSVGWSAWMDIAPNGISKAAGLEEVREEFGIDPAHTVCVGDSGNDCEMLEWAGIGVAMGNAPDYVKEHADCATDHVDDDGCAAVMEALLA